MSVQLLNGSRLVATSSGKGGTGKTTLSLALAHVLAEGNERAEGSGRVVLLDLDPQAGLTDYAGQSAADDPLRAEPVEVHGMTLYRSGRALGNATEADLAKHLARASSPAGRTVVADLSPALGDVGHRVVLSRPGTLVLLAVRLDGGGLKAARELTALADAKGVEYRIVPTFAKRWAIAQTVLSSLRAFYGAAVTETVIPEDVKAAECVAAGEPVTLYAPRSRSAVAIRDLVAELAAELAGAVAR